MRKFSLLLLAATCAWTQSPVITNITNAAIPSLDNPPATLHLPARAMATIYGTNLADSVVTASDGWVNNLAGTEVHLAADNCADASCDLVAQLIYVSPTQINFIVPANAASQSVAYRIVLIRDGVRIDNPNYLQDGPGRLVIDSPLSGTDLNDYNLVFQVGYDCLYSFSQANPAICGVSNDAGPNRAPLGAITDTYGRLISSANPAHQGQILTLWMTALHGNLVASPQSGLLEQAYPDPVAFGVADSGA